MAKNGSKWLPFGVAAGILLVCAVGWNVALGTLGVALAKKYVPLKKPLQALPETFGRFQLANHGEIPDVPDGKIKLTKDIEEILGTDKYITWIYRDTSRTSGPPVFVRLHVAYYTQLLDAVPHVPDICQLAGGMQAAEQARDVEWTVPGLQAPWDKPQLRRSSFTAGKSPNDPVSIIYYVFNVNGQPVSNRLLVRNMLISPFKKYCYYAKIEFSALGVNLTPEEHEEICRAFFTAAAPQLLGVMASAEEIRQMEDAQ